MIKLLTAGLFVGYTLVYAAVAAGGKFAERPWQALREDAYTGVSSSGGVVQAAGSGHHGLLGRLVHSAGGILKLVEPIPVLP